MKKVFVLFVIAILVGSASGVGIAATGAENESWEAVFRAKAAENLEEAVGKAIKKGAPTCDLTTTALDMKLNPYNILLEIFKAFMDPEEKVGLIKEAVACAKTAEVSDAIINQALLDAGADPNEYGLGYTPPGGPRFRAGAGFGTTARVGVPASPAVP